MPNPGFVHDLLDVKVLVLFVMARSKYPATTQQIYEMCFQDDRSNFFDVAQSIAELVESGHLEKKEKDIYVITEKGKENGQLTEDSILYSVRCRAETAVHRFNRQLRRSAFVKTSVTPNENGESTVILSLNDETGRLITMEMMAPNQRQGVKLSKQFEQKAEVIYNMIMTELLEEEEEFDG